MERCYWDSLDPNQLLGPNLKITRRRMIFPSVTLIGLALATIQAGQVAEASETSLVIEEPNTPFGGRRIFHDRPTMSGDLTHNLRPGLADYFIKTAESLPVPSVAISDRYIDRQKDIATICTIGCNLKPPEEGEPFRPFIVAMASGTVAQAFGNEAARTRPLSIEDFESISKIRLNWGAGRITDLTAVDESGLSVPYYFQIIKIGQR